MFVVRNTFTAKPGMASKLAKLMKEVMPAMTSAKVRVLTDYVGPMNTVVMESEVPSLAEWEKMLKDYSEKAEIQAKMKGYVDLYATGVREIYRVM